MTDIGPTGYMSDGEIVAWLEQKSNDQYHGLKAEMNASDDRAKLIEDLTDARAAVDGNDPNTAFDKLTAIAENCTDPETKAFVYDEQAQLLGWVTGGDKKSDDLKAAIEGSSLSDNDKQALEDKVTHARSVMDVTDTNADTDANRKIHDQQKQKVSEALDGRTTDLTHVDQVAMLNIQQAVADAKQTQELASNILSSREQASMAIVGNIRG
jgi:hypothetical protein